MRISEQELADAPIEKLRAEIKLLWKAFKEIDECENSVPSNQIAGPGKCKLCRDCMIRVAYHKPLEKPRLTVVSKEQVNHLATALEALAAVDDCVVKNASKLCSRDDEAPGIGDS